MRFVDFVYKNIAAVLCVLDLRLPLPFTESRDQLHFSENMQGGGFTFGNIE
jgi:hypothetical protein